MASDSIHGGGRDRDAPDEDVFATPASDWLYHHLHVAGNPADVAALRAAVAFDGVIPWRRAAAAEAERGLRRLLSSPAPQRRALGLEAGRVLAARLADAVEPRLAAGPAGRGCPFDLHRLLPLPVRLLRLGPAAPEVLTWLRKHWGTSEAPRGVVEWPRGRRRDPGVFWVGFWAADWNPWPAMRAVSTRWPALGVAVRPRHDGPP